MGTEITLIPIDLLCLWKQDGGEGYTSVEILIDEVLLIIDYRLERPYG